jgi:hypothetical protein
MDALGRSWLHYGVHVVSKNTVGSGVYIVFPEYEFEPHLHDSFFALCLTLRTPKNNGSPFNLFSEPLKMKRLSSDLVAFHTR